MAYTDSLIESAKRGELHAFRASDGALLPDVDSTSDESWARTWCEAVLFYLDATEHDPDGLQLSHNRGTYSVFDFVADRWIGDLPWTQEQADRVWALIKQHPRFSEIEALPRAAGWSG